MLPQRSNSLIKKLLVLLHVLLCMLALVSTTAHAGQKTYIVNDPSGTPVLATDDNGARWL